MTNAKIDRRVRYTKKVLQQSLLEMLKQQDINKITVKELCAVADVNRGTFYAHYQDPHALLSEIEDELFQEIKVAIGKRNPQLGDEEAYFLLLELLECIERHQEVCQVVWGQHGDSAFLPRVLDLAHQKCVEQWSQVMTKEDLAMVEYLYSFTVKGCVGLVEQWINSGMKEKPQQLADLINKIMYFGLQAFFVTEKVDKNEA